MIYVNVQNTLYGTEHETAPIGVNGYFPIKFPI